jgi:hypothetical protein
MTQRVITEMKSARKLCSVLKCENTAHARGLCDKHRTQIRRHGRLTPERELGQPRPKQPCTVEACDSHRVARGLCSRHYSQVRRHGHVLPDRQRARSRSRIDAFESFGDLLGSSRRFSPKTISENQAPKRSTSSALFTRDGDDQELTQLLGMAVVDVSKGRPSSVREELSGEQQRLVDIFRMLRAHRHGAGDPKKTANHSGMTVDQSSLWRNLALHAEQDETGSFVGRQESEDFAWLLGLYAAIRRSPAGGSPRPLRVRLDEEEAQELAEKTERLFGRVPSIRQVDSQYDVFFGSKELSQYLHDITAGNTLVPWEHLVTFEERRGFLASFLQRRCSLSAIGGVRPILAIGKRMAPSLRNGLLFLFAQLGIYPAFDESRIFLQALPELEKILKLKLISVPARHERLQTLVTNAPYDSLNIDVELYYRVLDGETSNRVPAETRRRWFLDELPPKIKRLERLAALFRKHSDPDAIGYLFRALGFSAFEARKQASRRSLREILTIVATLRHARIPEESWLSWLDMTPKEISAKLGGFDDSIVLAGGLQYRLTPRARMRYLQAYGLQPSEFKDFTICLEHIQDELQRALIKSVGSRQIASNSLVFSINGREIHSIRLAANG